MQEISKLDDSGHGFCEASYFQSAANLRLDHGHNERFQRFYARKPAVSASNNAAQTDCVKNIAAARQNIGNRCLDSNEKFYRIRREQADRNAANIVESSDKSSLYESPLCIGTSITKPKPPPAVSLKMNRDLAARGKISQVALLKRPTADRRYGKQNKWSELRKSITQKSTREMAFDSATITTNINSNHDVLSSLRKLSLIEPFLNSKKVPVWPVGPDNSFTLSKPVEFSPQTRRFSDKNNTSYDVEHGKMNSNPSNSDNGIFLDALTDSKDQPTSTSRLFTNAVADVERTSLLINTRGTGLHLSPVNDQDVLVPDVFCQLERVSSGLDNAEAYNNEAFVYKDPYENMPNAVKESRRKSFKSPAPLIASLEIEADKSKSKRRSPLTQRQLSYIGAVPPTAMVVDISTGGVVKQEPLTSTEDEAEVSEQTHQVRLVQGTKAGVPSSFYYNRKIKRRKKEDEIELAALKKLKAKAREEIKNILEKTACNAEETEIKKARSELSIIGNDNTALNVKVVEVNPFPEQSFCPSPPAVQAKELVAEKSIVDKHIYLPAVTSRPSSPSVASSSECSNCKIQPPTPNSSPQLDSDRFQIFPTTNPNTFHAYASFSSQPTVINMDNFLKAQSNVIAGENGLNKKPISMTYKKVTAPGTARILVTSGKARLGTVALKSEGLLDLSPLNIKTLSKSDSASSENDENTQGNNYHKPKRESVGTDTEAKCAGDSTDDEHLTSSKKKTEKPKYTPLQSLVIKSCRSVNPIVVMPPIADEAPTSIPQEYNVSGHLSPLKGIRILRRKVTVRHFKDGSYFPEQKEGYTYSTIYPSEKPSDHDSMNDKQLVDSVEQNFTNGNVNISAGTENSSRVFIPSKLASKDGINNLNHQRLTKYINVKNPSKTALSKHNRMNAECAENSNDTTRRLSIKGTINIDSLCLRGGNVQPYLLLKDGGSQSLNFLNTASDNEILAPVRSQASSGEPRKRRRRVQLGSCVGSDDQICVKISAGGGFKSNLARYSLLHRQRKRKSQDDRTKTRMEQSLQLPLCIDDQNKVNLGQREERLEATTGFAAETKDLNDEIENPEHHIGSSNTMPGDRTSNKTLSKVTLSPFLGSQVDISEELYSHEQQRKSSLDSTAVAAKEQGIVPQDILLCDYGRQSVDIERMSRLSLYHQSLPNLPDLNATYTNPNSAAILPDSGTASYRLTNDVSFDEGSRYKGVGNAFTAFGPPSEEQKNPTGNRRRNTQGNSDGQSGPTSQNSRFEKLSDSGNRGRLTPAGHVTTGGYKETVPMSLIRIEERLNFDPPQGRHQSPGYLSPPVPGSRGNSANGGSNLTSSSLSANTASMSTFRQNRDRENWSYKVGNLSVNGGGYYGSSPVLPGARADTSGIGSLSLNSTSNISQKFSQGREKNGNSNKSRLSSRYGSRYETTSAKDGGFADPCINPPSSFQQRLTELSMLESDTIKYERNRKLKRKSKQDKDS
ncbi:uncharacterized protein LOC143448386 [Clavelina lepadiformis]|uniref:uncharacterized protein LOC143448386 n=1 Tax=Clavelina lepadiformis TaxID=159417 RepID=UPI0040422291